MYCISCGAEIADGSKFCPQCGAKQGGGSTAAENNYSSNAQPSDYNGSAQPNDYSSADYANDYNSAAQAGYGAKAQTNGYNSSTLYDSYNAQNYESNRETWSDNYTDSYENGDTVKANPDDEKTQVSTSFFASVFAFAIACIYSVFAITRFIMVFMTGTSREWLRNLKGFLRDTLGRDLYEEFEIDYAYDVAIDWLKENRDFTGAINFGMVFGNILRFLPIALLAAGLWIVWISCFMNPKRPSGAGFSFLKASNKISFVYDLIYCSAYVVAGGLMVLFGMENHWHYYYADFFKYLGYVVLVLSAVPFIFTCIYRTKLGKTISAMKSNCCYVNKYGFSDRISSFVSIWLILGAVSGFISIRATGFAGFMNALSDLLFAVAIIAYKKIIDRQLEGDRIYR